jgi:hypothetical protein
MKKLLVTLAAVLVSASVLGQGTINFATRIAGIVDAPVFKPDGVTGAGAGTAANAQLFLVGAGGALTPLTPVTTFRATPAGAAQNYVIPVEVTVPGVATGGSATVRLRAWEGASYDTASVFGQSADLVVNNLGGPVTGAPPATPANLAGLQGFTMIPEPSTMALGLLGAAALLYRRRK